MAMDRPSSTLCRPSPSSSKSLSASVKEEDMPIDGGGKIPGMESVVASVTGYVGSERLTLVKLINLSGGHFIGRFRKASTHLVCWKLEGEKYELAKKWGTLIVNHRWFEDCMKARKRLPENPYTSFCGKDVGAIKWRIPIFETISVPRVKVVSHDMVIDGNLVTEQRSQRKEKTQWQHREPPSILASTDLTWQDEVCFSETMLVQERKRLKKVGKELEASNRLLCMDHKGKNKLESPRTRMLSCSILNYVSISSEKSNAKHALRHHNDRSEMRIEHINDVSDDQNADRCVLDENEVEAHIRFNDKHEQKIQLPLSSFESMRPRKKHRLQKRISDKVAMMPWLVGDDNDNISAINRCYRLKSSKEYIIAASRNEDGPSCQPSVFSLSPSPPCIDIACVICHMEKIVSSEGILPCGHCFCFSCIHKWALESSSKVATCPLCKATFDVITKREKKVNCEGDNASSSSPSHYDEMLVMVGSEDKHDENYPVDANDIDVKCMLCGIGDMDELLLTCGGCGRSAHSFCLDPPLPPIPSTPWFCGRCSQQRRVDWYQSHAFGRRLA